jgi:hypothetical protein
MGSIAPISPPASIAPKFVTLLLVQADDQSKTASFPLISRDSRHLAANALPLSETEMARTCQSGIRPPRKTLVSRPFSFGAPIAFLHAKWIRSSSPPPAA